jgi:hypothetical protein
MPTIGASGKVTRSVSIAAAVAVLQATTTPSADCDSRNRVMAHALARISAYDLPPYGQWPESAA